MREILFRGIGKISEEWEKGYLVIDEDTHTIITIDEGWNFLEVIPETVGQYTGSKDKNGNKIFEGDIVKIKEDWEEYGTMAGEEREVYFKNGGFRLKPKIGNLGCWLEYTEDMEIIGNIHEGEEDDCK